MAKIKATLLVGSPLKCGCNCRRGGAIFRFPLTSLEKVGAIKMLFTDLVLNLFVKVRMARRGRGPKLKICTAKIIGKL